MASRDVLCAVVVDAFAQLNAEQLVARLEAAQIANARVNEMRDVWAHPQLQARGRWTEVGSAAGPIPALKPPGPPKSFNARMDPVPALGENTHTLLAELGYGADEITALQAAGAI